MRTFYKKFLVFVFFFLAASSLSFAAPYTLTLGDVNFDETTGTITDYTASETDIEIPATFNNVDVVAIDDYAFFRKGLTSVTIPNNVTSIGVAAFSNNSLTSVTIPNSVTSLGDYAFNENSLTSVVLSDNLTSMGSQAFNTNSITEVNGEPSNGLFFARNDDGSVDDSEIVSYGGEATDIDFIPGSVTSIGSGAFYKNSLTSVTIPNSVTSIGDYAFKDNSLTSVTIPNSVSSIGNRAFANNSLTSVSLSGNLTSMGYQAFNSNSITEVNGEPGNGLFFARNDDGSVDHSKVVSYGGEATDIDFIPNSVNTIGESAFRENSLTSVVFPDNLTDIGESAFRENSLTSVILPDNLTHIREYAFCENSLTSLTLSDNLTYIELGAFYSNNLTSLALPNHLTFIGGSAFYQNNLTSVTFSDNLRSIGSSAFEDNSLSSITLPPSLTRIERYAFTDNELTSFALPDSHTEFSSSNWEGANNDETHAPGEVVSNLKNRYTLEGVSNVHYILQGGQNSSENPFSFKEDEGVDSFQPATREGYDFAGWFDEDGNEVTSVPSGTFYDVVLYAKWDVASGVAKNPQSDFHLYPNPASHYLVIDAKAGSCEIFDISGKMVLQESVHEGRQSIDVSSLPNGIYVVKAGQKRERVVIQR